MTVRVLVADDELLARKRLTRLLAAIDGVEIAGECASGNEVISRVRAGDIDVILLDIHMPGLSGLEALSILGDAAPLVVLCTAHSDHALEAFEAGAIDYVMKPVEAGRLKKAMDRAMKMLASKAPEGRDVPLDSIAQKAGEALGLSRLALATKHGIVLLDPSEITHAIIDGELVTVATESATYISDEPLSELVDRLPSDTFARVHRRAIVNLAKIVRLEPIESGGFVAHTRAGHRVEVSRLAARELRKRLGLK
jgi:two-component system, LytTR family, response regulator